MAKSRLTLKTEQIPSLRATRAKLKFKNNPCAENSASTKTGISSARVKFKILKVALVVRDFNCVKNENPICKRWRNFKI